MIALGLDAGLGGFSAAVCGPGGEPLAAIELPGNVAREHGLAAIGMVLRQAAIAPAGLDRIGVGIGPGSFTGVRIAISYAKSLAQGWKRPLAGISSFDALEAGLIAPPGRTLLAVVRGRQGVVSVRLRAAGAERRASGYGKDVLDELSGGLDGKPVTVLGNAEDVLAALGERASDVQILSRAVEPAALAVATLAMEREPARSLHEIRADYGELPAAKIPKLGGALGESPT